MRCIMFSFTVVILLIAIAVAVVVVLGRLYRNKRSPLQRAQEAHHAEPPLGQTALRHYEKSIDTEPSTTAILEMAAIYDHGIYQGPEPVLPSPDRALMLYEEVVMVGAHVDRQLAKERIVEIARDRPRIFPNPPPRRQHVVLVPPEEPRTNVEIIQNVNRAPRSDSQNVHDSSVVKSVKAALQKLGPSPLSMEQTLVNVRRTLVGNEDAAKGLDLIETNTVPVSSLNMREVDVLRKVWGRIEAEADPERKNNMRDMLVGRIAECGKEASCASGRVARMVDSLATFDDAVNLRPLWALRQEMMAKAGVLQSEESEVALDKRLREQFTKDYVETGLMTMEVMEAEVASWGEL